MAGDNPFNAGPGGAKKAAPAKKAQATAPAAGGGVAVADADEDAAPDTSLTADASSVPEGTDPFADPGSGGSDYKFAELIDELLLIEPYEFDKMVTTVSKGELQDFVRANIIRLDNENELVEDVLVFQTAVIRSLKKVMRGTAVWSIGRLYRGVAKGGKSAPYLLAEATPEEKQQAIAVAKQMKLTLTRTAGIL